VNFKRSDLGGISNDLKAHCFVCWAILLESFTSMSRLVMCMKVIF